MISYKWVLLSVVLTTLVACHNNDDDDSNEDISSNAVITTLNNSDDWRITYFNDSGEDETSDYSRFLFSFNDNGTVLVSGGTAAVNGTWATEDSQSSDDSPDDVDLILNFGSSDPLEELNEDWDIITVSDYKIELIHVSGGNGGTDYLTFEK